ncbi:MAG: hypothetical protein ACI97A_000269 [Planctomycetota bacterium]|jgi:hypothetical protein
MKEHKENKTKDLRVFYENRSGTGTVVIVVVFFVFCVGAGAILKMMTTSAGRGWVGHLAIWLPLALLIYYVSRAARSYNRLPQQNDLEFSERLRLRLEAEALQAKKTPTPQKASAELAVEDPEKDSGATLPESNSPELEPPSSPTQ